MKKLVAHIVALAALTVCHAAHAGPGWEFQAASTSFSNGSWNFANNFRVLNDLVVSGLGYYADPSSGSVDNNAVALFKSDGTLLARATVTNANDLTGHFRYVTINPITLTAGNYQVVGVSAGDAYTWNNVGFTTDSRIQYLGNAWQADTNGVADFLDHNNNDVRDGYWGANIYIGQASFARAAAVPEPGSLALLGLALAGCAAASRGRAKRR